MLAMDILSADLRPLGRAGIASGEIREPTDFAPNDHKFGIQDPSTAVWLDRVPVSRIRGV